MNLYNDILYPGTYNPIHNGHLDIAEKAKQELGAEKIVLIPAFSPYHKANSSNASSVDRFEMTKLAAESRNGFEVSDVEYRMGKEKSFTFETVKQLISDAFGTSEPEKYPLKQKLKLIIGADSLENLEKWYEASKLSKLVDFIVISRPNSSDVNETAKKVNLPDFSFKSIQANFDISSTKVRELIQQGHDASRTIPKAVLEYIDKKKLYR